MNNNIRSVPTIISAVLFLMLLLMGPSLCQAAVIFKSDFDSNSLSGWNQESANQSYSITTNSSIKRLGNYSARFELHKTDPNSNVGSKRSELSLETEPALQERWYAFSTYLPNGGSEDYADDVASEIIAQWHNYPDANEGWTSPPLGLATQNGHWNVFVNWDDGSISTNNTLHSRSYDLGVNEKGVWVDWVFNVKWGWLTSQNPKLAVYKRIPSQSAAYAQVIYDTERNMTNDQRGVYFKLGIYKWPWAGDYISNTTARVIYHDQVKIGDGSSSLNEVAPPVAANSNWNCDFTGSQLNTPPSGAAYINGYYTRGIHSFKPENGVYGKPQGDTSLHISSIGSDYGANWSTDFPGLNMPYLQYQTNVSNVGGGDKVLISAMILNNDSTTAKTIQIKACTDNTTTPKATSGDFFTFNTNGTAACFGTTIPNVYLCNNTWYKIDGVLYGGTGKVDLYINGKKVVDQQVFDASSSDSGIQVFTGLSVLRVYYMANIDSGTVYKPASMYVDDLGVEFYGAGDTFYAPASMKSYPTIYDFSGLEDNTPNYAYSGTAYSNIGSPAYLVHNFKHVNGVFGKDASDSSFSLSSRDDVNYPEAAGLNQYLYNPYMSINFQQSGYSSTDKIYLGMNIAFKDITSTYKYFTTKTFIEGSTSWKNPSGSNIFTFGNHYLSVFGKDVSNSSVSTTGSYVRNNFSAEWQINKWYKLECVITPGAPNYIDVYLDGILVAQQIPFDADSSTSSTNDPLYGLASVRFGYNTTKIDSLHNRYSAGGLYLDDIVYKVYNENETYVTIGNIQFKNGNQNADVLTPGNISATVDVTNYDSEKMPVALMIAVYIDGALKAIKMEPCILDNTPTTLTTDTVNITDTNGVTVKAMLWDSVYNMKPLLMPKILVHRY